MGQRLIALARHKLNRCVFSGVPLTAYFISNKHRKNDYIFIFVGVIIQPCPNFNDDYLNRYGI